MNNIDIAKTWADFGISPIPLQYRSKHPNFRAFNNTGDVDDNRKPSWKKFQKEVPDNNRIKVWFSSKFVNLAVITGQQGLTIIDFDNMPIWKLWESWINSKHPEILKTTYLVKTKRGLHVYLLIEEKIERTLKVKSDDNTTLIDIKAAGGYCAAPFSIHPSGHIYQAINRPSDIMTVSSLRDVLPGMLLERALSDVEIPEYTNGVNGHIDPFKAVPTSIQGDPIGWIKRNRSILEFFPNAVPSGGNRWLKVICPLHEDHNESGWIDLQRQRFGCHAGCAGRGVDIVDFLCLLKGIDRKGAISELAR